MEPAGGVAWPARGGPGDGSLIRREISSPPAWEPPQKKVRNNSFQGPASTYPSQETANYARGDGQGVFSPGLSQPPPSHAAGEQAYGGQESFGSFSQGQGMPGYGGQQQMQPSNGYAQDNSHAPGRSFNIPPQGSSPSPGFPPGSAKGTGALFLKTKLCTKFKLGTCTFNERCHFAHGMEDLRKPPLGWETMVANAGQGGPLSARTSDENLQQRKKSSKPCRFFADGKECPYGDRCTFVHVTGGEDVYPASGFGSSDSGGFPAPRLKTRLCARWERGEACNYGERCHYAHGYAELQSSTGASAYGNDSAPAANNMQYPNTNLETAPFPGQFSNAKNLDTISAPAPMGGSFPAANMNAPSNAYPNMGSGAHQPVNTFTRNQGYWNGAQAQGGFAENQTAGLWTGHPVAAEGGYSKDPASVAQYLPAQVQQQPMVQPYTTNVGVYQDPKQSVNMPYMQDGGSGNFQPEVMGGNGGYYPATYFPNHPT